MIREIKYLIPVVAGVFGLSQFAAAHSVELKTRVDRPLIIKSGGEQIYEAQVTGADGTVRDVMFHKAVFFEKCERVRNPNKKAIAKR